ncbi:MAG: ABC-F family ATP-binding cassette domain-containing protein [Aggregatilineales bacterium]
MSLLTGTKLSKFYGPDEIFSDVTIEIPHHSRIALVGPNGAGKTTLLHLIVGEDTPTEGSIHIARGSRIGFLPQRPELVGSHTLWEEAMTAFTELREMEGQLNQLEHDMADPDKHDVALEAYGPLQEKFERDGGYIYESKLRMVLMGVGFETDDYDMPLTQLSGGQKTRAVLARLLLEEPDLLVLDEPTNHLDINAIEWLEKFLREFPGAVLAVSHDRYFMDSFASAIWEMDYGTLETYRGNYSHYVQQRAERYERHIKEYESQQAFLTKEQDYIRKHMGSRWTAQAKGRQKKLATMQKRGKIIGKPRGHRKEMNLRIETAMRSGDKVLMTGDLTVGYEQDDPLLTVPEITLWRGETAALIGPNGVGKSTFLKTVIGELPALDGVAMLGASVQVGYFAQAHERLDPSNTLVDEITDTKSMPISEARAYLARYLFTGDDVFRKVGTLSGGERGRLALAKLALGGANLLLLDEPTNHLDIESQEVLQEVLGNFDGTILIVSHDRYLIDALATQIWSAQPGMVNLFKGTYREFLDERNKREQSEKAAEAAKTNGNGKSNGASNTEKKHGLNPFELKKRLSEVEKQIHALEARMETLNAEIATASADGNAFKVSKLGEEYMQTESDLEAMMEEWTMLAE